MAEPADKNKSKIKGPREALVYDAGDLLATWRMLPSPPTAEKLHAALTARGFKCSVSWVRRKVAKHHLVALGRTGLTDSIDDKNAQNMKAVRRFLEQIGKDMDPNAMLSGLQTQTMVQISDYLRSMTDEKVANPEWLTGMMKFYAQITSELTHTYQKRIEAGDKLPLPERKIESDEKVLPWKAKNG